MMQREAFELNGVRYRWPSRPIVVVCIDGGDPAYFDAGLRAGVIPNVARFMESGFYAVADGTVPSFTCPNNMSIVTGAEPDVHGISGNYFLDPETREPVTMTGPELLRSSTVLAEFARRGAKVVSITSKDKLRLQLQKGVDVSRGNASFSAQYAEKCTLAENGVDDALALAGMPQPDMYSAELSLFVLEAGIALLESRRPDISYLSLTDFIQHKHAPEASEALDFYARLDEAFSRLEALGALVALVADHGMNDKAKEDGTPNVIWLQDVLDEHFGKSSTVVICPITDPFVAHHGALGGFVRVYRNGDVSTKEIMSLVADLPGVEAVYDRAGACAAFSLPPDREGDVAVVADARTCIGASAAEHDLSGLEGHRLRTHGGVSEARVPFVLSQPLCDEYREAWAERALRSHQIFDFAVNGTRDS